MIFHWISVAFPYNWYKGWSVPVIRESNGNPIENQVLPRYHLSQGPVHSSRLQFSICVCQRLLKNPTRRRKGSPHLMSPILYRLTMLAGAKLPTRYHTRFALCVLVIEHFVVQATSILRLGKSGYWEIYSPWNASFKY